MSAYSGPQGRGARRRLRELKREEAEARNLLTLPHRRRNAAGVVSEPIDLSQRAVDALADFIAADAELRGDNTEP